MVNLTYQHKKYREVSNRYSDKIKFVDKSEIDCDSDMLKFDIIIFNNFFKKYIPKT